MNRKEVLVHTKSGRSFRGILYRTYGRWVVLKSPTLLMDGGTTTDLEGELYLDRQNLDFMQVIR